MKMNGASAKDSTVETTLLLVDDHAMFRMGLRLLLDEEPDFRVVGEAGDGQKAIQLAQDLSPDVVLMDINMPTMDGVEATRRILEKLPGIKVIILSAQGDKGVVKRSLQAGARGYLLKESVPEELVRGLRAVSWGEIFLSDAITDVVVEQYIDQLSAPPDAVALIRVTKLHRPQIAQPTVDRPRLLTQFEGWRQRPLTLVSAPAGYGKSTLVCQWIENGGYPAAWLSLDEDDDDLRVFLTYLVAAVQMRFPELLQQTSNMLKAPVLPPMQVLANTLVNELASCPQPFILVLDDYHVIVDQGIQDLLSELLRRPPKPLHLVLITRTDPSLDLLKLRAYNQVGEVRAQALSFTLEETATFLEQMSGHSVRAAIVEALLARTEGWVTGLRLLTLSSTNGDSIGGANGGFDLANASAVLPGEQQTLDYLVAEALSRQPEELRASLLKTSILDRFCASLCEAVCEPQDLALVDEVSDGAEIGGLGGEAFIQSLAEQNLFVIALDHRGRWYRYHHLFAQLLHSQLENWFEAEEIAAVHLRASQWFVYHGMIEEAIKHAVAGGDLAAAARIIEQNRSAIQNEDRTYDLEAWLSMLPREVVHSSPELLLAQAWISILSLNFPILLSVLTELEVMLSRDGIRDAMHGELDYFRGYLACFQGQGSLALEYMESALSKIPEANHLFRAEAELNYSRVLLMVGRKEMALSRLNRLVSAPRGQEGIVSTRLWFGLYLIHWSDGQLAEAMAAANKVREIASRDDNRYAETFGFYLEACAHFYGNEMESAVEAFGNLVTNRYIVYARASIDGLCALSLAYQQLNNPDQADETVRLLFEYAANTNDPAHWTMASSLQARLSLLRGDAAQGLVWLHEFDPATDPGLMFSWSEIPRITACRVQIAQGDPEGLQKAVQCLRTYQAENQAVHNSFQVIVILPLLALAYHKQGKEKQALAVLEEALVLAKSGGWIWPFIELGSPMASMLRRLKMQGLAVELADYVAEILAYCVSPDSSSPSDAHQPGDIDALTRRELQVLRMLATALSGDEIAARLIIGVGTVRSHTKSIYAKLDVHSRNEAIHRARKMGLI